MSQKLRSQTPYNSGIANPCQKHYDLGFIQKSMNRRPHPAFEGSRSSTKRHKALTHDPLKKIRREMPSNRRIKRRTKNPRKGSENHQKGKTGKTHPSLEEPRRIIYTYQRGSYKVYLAARSSSTDAPPSSTSSSVNSLCLPLYFGAFPALFRAREHCFGMRRRASVELRRLAPPRAADPPPPASSSHCHLPDLHPTVPIHPSHRVKQQHTGQQRPPPTIFIKSPCPFYNLHASPSTI
jgi:hypothetical protein